MQTEAKTCFWALDRYFTVEITRVTLFDLFVAEQESSLPQPNKKNELFDCRVPKSEKIEYHANSPHAY